MQREDSVFVRLFKGSHGAVWRVAHHYWKNGYNFRMNAVSIAPSAKDWRDYVDGGDIHLQKPGTEDWVRVEVKHRNLDFTDLASYKYKDIMVCAKHSYDEPIEKPRLYVILNKDMTHAAFIKTTTFDSWRHDYAGDCNYGDGYTQAKYYCPKELAIFHKLTTEV